MKKLLQNSSVAQKLRLSFTTIIAFLVLIIVLSLTSVTMISYYLMTFYNTSFQVVEEVNSAYSNLQEGAKNMLHACLTTDSATVKQRLDLAQTEFDTLDSCTSRLSGLYDANRENISAIRQDVATIQSEFTAFQELCLANDIEGAFAIYNDHMLPVFANISSNVTTIQEYADSLAVSTYDKAILIRTICFMSLVLFSVISITLAFYLSRTLSGLLVHGILEVKEAASKMAHGDFDISFTYEGRDELAELGREMSAMTNIVHDIIDDSGFIMSEMAQGNFTVGTKIEEKYVGIFEQLKLAMRNLNRKLNETLKQIALSAQQVNLGADQMSESAQALADGATDQAGSIQELQATISSVTQMVTDSSQKMKTSYQDVIAYRSEAQSGGAEMKELTAAMLRIDEASQQINRIVSDIEGIASQTNLLSLNASIEAARAGEAGRGFAVVADQIRQLADDSAQSAVRARGFIESSIQEISNGNSITERTAISLEKVVSGMEKIADSTQDAADGYETQAASMEQINQGIEQISSVVQNNSATAEETSATSEELSAQATTMHELVNTFRLRD